MNYIGQPIIQIMDSYGNPIVNGKVYVYDSETQNLATIYRDFEGHLQTNPAILDTLGHAVIIADEEKVYTVVVKDQYDNLQFTLENVRTVGTGGGSEPVEQQKVQVANGDGIAVTSETLLDGTVVYRVAVGNDIKNRITKNENDIANMESSHTARLSALENTVDNHETRITNNEINIGSLQSDVYSIDSSVSSIDNRLNSVESKIPYEASSSNKLADKQYVMNVVSQMGARYITNAEGEAFETHASLIAGPWYNEGETTILVKNDYAIVNGDETHGGTVTRYMYDGTAWAYQYTINSTVFTQEQLNAMNSGITSANVEKLDGIAAGAEVNVQSNWTQTDTSKDDYIKNKPGNATTTTSGFMSATDKEKLNGIAAGAEVNIQSDWNVSDTTSKAYIKNKPTSLPASDVYQWAKATTKPSYTASEVGTYSSGDIDNLLSNKVTANTAITGATKCKITYDSKGLVTAGANLAASDIPSLAADKITSGTFADARIASASTWNAKADDSAVVHNTGNETIAGRKTFTSSPIFNASSGNTDIQAYKPGTTTLERCSLTYATDNKRGVWDNKIGGFALLIDSNNQVTLNGTASKVSQTVGYGAIVSRDSNGNLKYTNDYFSTVSDDNNGNMLVIKSTDARGARIKLQSKGSTNNYSAYLRPQNGYTAERTFSLPDKSGTLALTDDIPTDVASLTGNNRFTGTNTFNSGTYMNSRLYIQKTSTDNTGLEIENSQRKIKMTISSGQLKLEDDAGKTNSPSSAQTILYSTGTGNNTEYILNGEAKSLYDGNSSNSGVNLNNMTTPGLYYFTSSATSGWSNYPSGVSTSTLKASCLKVESFGGGVRLYQWLYLSSNIYYRMYVNGSGWYEWYRIGSV